MPLAAPPTLFYNIFSLLRGRRRSSATRCIIFSGLGGGKVLVLGLVVVVVVLAFVVLFLLLAITVLLPYKFVHGFVALLLALRFSAYTEQQKS